MMLQRLVFAGSVLSLLTACNAAKFSANKKDLLSKSSAFGDYYGQINQPGAVGNGITQGAGAGGDASGSIHQPGGSDASGGIQQPGGGPATGGIQQPGGGPANGGIQQPGGGPANGGIVQLPGGGVCIGGVCTAPGGVRQPDGGDSGGKICQPDGTNDEVDLLLMCSDKRSEDNPNFKNAVANNLPVQLLLDTKICTSDINVIKGLVEKKKFTIADAQAICPGLVPAAGKWSNVSLVIDGTAYNSIRGTITLLYARNNDDMPANEVADALCDKRSSPLVIHINSDVNNPRPVELSSQANGIFYDLLGARNNYQAVRISWFTNKQYGLLTLPDRAGRVNGIDQLFGNATIGPDGLFSENGYQALAKYDGTTVDGHFQVASPDGRIDARDPIYSRLRVWVDSNRNGRADSRELFSLAQAGVTFIDLDYSSDFAETDAYGNQTLMKSVVGRADGSLDLIFDLWFAYEFGGR